VDKLCKTCKKRSTCTSLCPEAEKYVNQDYVRRKEITFTELGIDIDSIKKSDSNTETNLTRNQLLIWELHISGYSNHEIARLLDKDRSYIIKTIKKLKDYYF